jgi:phosphoribosylformylglycinamidine cyclo-ligase
LSPTRTFAPIIKHAVENYRDAIHGIVHNTGGAQTKCLKYIEQPVRLIKDNLFNPPLIFDLIQEASKISYHEMYQVFNMGTRLELYTDQQTAEAIISFAKTLDVDAQIVGRVEASEQKEVIIRSQFGEFQYK